MQPINRVTILLLNGDDDNFLASYKFESTQVIKRDKDCLHLYFIIQDWPYEKLFLKNVK